VNTLTYTNDIHSTLKQLIELKSKRDNCKFTIYQLAKAINMPHSMLVKLAHQDPSKRVINPRIETLTKIINFFKQDDFNVSLEELLHGLKKKGIDVEAQIVSQPKMYKAVPLYNMNNDKIKIGSIDVSLTINSNSVIAFLTDDDIKPIFKKGSIFIVDIDCEINHDVMVLVKFRASHKVSVCKFFKEEEYITLKSLDGKFSSDEKNNNNYEILGAVVQVNAKT
jgi:transcriptional regulator with XRE-family HTH domain